MGKEMMIQATEIAGGQWQLFRDALKSADLPADDIDLPGRTFFEFTLDGETVAWEDSKRMVRTGCCVP